MPSSTVLDIPPEEQVQMLAALRRARYGYLLGCVCKVYITPNHKMIAAISHMAL
jgi:hypothetical protein